MRMAMMAITTNSSISVKPSLRLTMTSLQCERDKEKIIAVHYRDRRISCKEKRFLTAGPSDPIIPAAPGSPGACAPLVRTRRGAFGHGLAEVACPRSGPDPAVRHRGRRGPVRPLHQPRRRPPARPG